MNQGMMMNTITSAIVGGVIGAGVVFFGASSAAPKDLSELAVTSLTVENLTITNQASLVNSEGREEIVLREGSVLAENVVLGRKFIGRQIQGHAIVANRVFTTPDDLIATPMENWRFYAEIGASHDAGGEVVVRNAHGPASVNRPTNNGALLRMGFDPETRPQVLALNNLNRSPMQINFDLSEMQRQLLSAASANQGGMMQQIPAGSFDGSAVPPSATLAQPDGSQFR